ncbi:site-specific recombinase [Myxococcota bacterium]|nr:site-specific recombinase [Myxococcota bacterium]
MDRFEAPSSLADVATSIAPLVAPPVVAELGQLFAAMLPAGPLEARVEWVGALVRWLSAEGPLVLPPSASVSGRSRSARLWLFVEVLRRAPAWREATGRLVRSVLTEASALRLFAESGLARDHGFFGEAAHRLAKKLLPAAPDERDLSDLVGRTFASADDVAWLDELPPELVADAFTTLFEGEGDDAWRAVRNAAADAIHVLAMRAAALGLSDDLRQRGSGKAVAESAFARLCAACTKAAELLRFGVRAGSSPLALEDARGSVERVITEARAELEVVVGHLENYGVSVDLVFRMERIGAQLARIDGLLRTLIPSPGDARGAAVMGLFVELVREIQRDRSLRALLARNIRQLSRKVIERAGETGEHYITSSAAEYRHMLASAAGGGVLTTATTVLKYLLGALSLPFFFQGLFASLNYAGSFLVMHFLGFTLATKQPSMTAATLAGSIQHASGDPNLEGLTTLIARITRSQLAAAIGNIGAVVPTALLFDLVHVLVTGEHFLGPEDADYTIASLHPWQSGTIFYAALTGVFLWTSSVAAGWLDNWAVYRRLPDAIARHPVLRRSFGDDRAARLGAFLGRHTSAFGGNVALGFLLGMTAVFGKFFGLPLDVRHVTLSSGSLALAASTKGLAELALPAFELALAGIAIIGLLNFGVSFALALWVALRARGVTRSSRWRLVRRLLVALVTSPRAFVLPPRDAAPAHAPVEDEPRDRAA